MARFSALQGLRKNASLATVAQATREDARRTWRLLDHVKKTASSALDWRGQQRLLEQACYMDDLAAHLERLAAPKPKAKRRAP